jgi:hypothetical protein
MAIAKPEVEWLYDTDEFLVDYGLINIGDKWAVVKAKYYDKDNYEFVTDWMDDYKTAIGFIKLLKE